MLLHDPHEVGVEVQNLVGTYAAGKEFSLRLDTIHEYDELEPSCTHKRYCPDNQICFAGTGDSIEMEQLNVPGSDGQELLNKNLLVHWWGPEMQRHRRRSETRVDIVEILSANGMDYVAVLRPTLHFGHRRSD